MQIGSFALEAPNLLYVKRLVFFDGKSGKKRG